MLPPYDTYQLSVMRQADLRNERNTDRTARLAQSYVAEPERLLRRVGVAFGLGWLRLLAKRTWQVR